MTDWNALAQEFDAANPHVYPEFCKYAEIVWNAGRRKIAARIIWDRIRWDSQIKTACDQFKMNSNFETYFSRKYMEQYPERDGFFTTRTRNKK